MLHNPFFLCHGLCQHKTHCKVSVCEYTNRGKVYQLNLLEYIVCQATQQKLLACPTELQLKDLYIQSFTDYISSNLYISSSLGESMISVLRFLDRPSGVELVSTGS